MIIFLSATFVRGYSGFTWANLSIWLAPLTLVAWGCGGDTSAPRFSLLVSGDTHGWIVPCGCASNQSGGLLRRGTLVKQLRAQTPVIVADAGGAAAGTSAYDRLRFESILRGERLLEIAAHNIGASEAACGAAYLRKVAQQTGVPLVSSNVLDADGRKVAEPLRIVRAGRRRVAILGVLGEQFSTAGLQVTSPRQAILGALRAAAGQYDCAIVLAYLSDDELTTLAAALPEVDAVIGGPTGQPLALRPVGRVLVTSATNQGKFLVRLDAPASAADRWDGTIIELDERLADDSEQVANLQQMYQALEAHDWTPADTSFVKATALAPGEFAVTGNNACRPCHPDEFRLWEESLHAHAWRSLVDKGTHVDPDCQRCHTTGYGLAGGFASLRRSADRVDVGCESCHGPSLLHAHDQNRSTAFGPAAKDQCQNCHDRENSPRFAYEPYWEKIRHGTPPEAAETAQEGDQP